MTPPTIDAYPLTWPDGWPRTVPHRRMGSPYRVQLAGRAEGSGGRGSNSRARAISPCNIAIDCWRTVRENMRAVGLAIESLRTFERSGAKEVQRRAYAGFARLPAAPDHWATLGLARGSSVAAITARYRDLARTHHPDAGGTNERFNEITRAMQDAIREVSP